jgi:hypothetical protein
MIFWKSCAPLLYPIFFISFIPSTIPSPLSPLTLICVALKQSVITDLSPRWGSREPLIFHQLVKKFYIVY